MYRQNGTCCWSQVGGHEDTPVDLLGVLNVHGKQPCLGNCGDKDTHVVGGLCHRLSLTGLKVITESIVMKSSVWTWLRRSDQCIRHFSTVFSEKPVCFQVRMWGGFSPGSITFISCASTDVCALSVESEVGPFPPAPPPELRLRVEILCAFQDWRLLGTRH